MVVTLLLSFHLHIVFIGNAYLVSEWLRVGYTQGNMNSDNTQLAGRTIDYGPYGWLERFDPRYQPFTSDSDGKFSFMSQPTAMNVNMIVLGQSMEILLKAVLDRLGRDRYDEAAGYRYLTETQALAKSGFQDRFKIHYDEMRRRKLGLDRFESGDESLWNDLLSLMYR